MLTLLELIIKHITISFYYFQSWVDALPSPEVMLSCSKKQLEAHLIESSKANVKDPFKWTFCHALCGTITPLLSVVLTTKIFECISQSIQLRQYLLRPDKEGDTAIMSAINSKVVSGKKLRAIFQFLSKSKRKKSSPLGQERYEPS